MLLDVHVHISATTPEHGYMSPRLLNSLPFRFIRWKLGIVGNDAASERALEKRLIETIDQSPLDAVALLAFDAVYDRDGRFDQANTHLYVKNDYIIELAARYPKVLLGASIHPYRKDAVAELERCIKADAVLLKWLPMVQGFDPDDELCIPFYEALAHHGLPLLSHTGAENALPVLKPRTADPALLEEALRRGVKVIMAHCGSRLMPWETDYVDTFMQFARKYEHCYGDTSALNVPNRWYAFDRVMKDPDVYRKLLHGSDWPILSMPPMTKLGMHESWELLRDPNWMKRDILIKQGLGFDQAYWKMASTVLKLPAGVA